MLNIDFTTYKEELEKAMKRYEKNAQDDGVAHDDQHWTIAKLTPTEIDILIDEGGGGNNQLKMTVRQTGNPKQPMVITLYDSDPNELPILLSTPECGGAKGFKNLIWGLNRAAWWVISNAL